MKELLEPIAQTLQAGRPLMLVSVISSSGSTPRKAGSAMLVFGDGTSAGTIGGGAVEHAAQARAARLLLSKASAVERYNLTADDVANLGMICGGDVTVLFQYLDPAQKEIALFETAADLLSQNKNVWLLRKIYQGRILDMGLYYKGAVHFSDAIGEEEIKPLLRGRPVLTDGEPAIFAEPVIRAGYVYIFGGGHVSQELVPVLARIDFQCIVFEERERFADPALFPTASRTVVGSYECIAEKISLGPEDYVVILTRGHLGDRAVLRQALQSQASYVGCIGSRKKVAATRQALMEAGIPPEDFDRVRTPIGLEIKAETPAEIAVSIAAQLILHRAQQRSVETLMNYRANI